MKKKYTKNLAVSLNSVTKNYALHHEKPTFVENVFWKNKREEFTALRDLSIEIEKGQRVGVIGKNGSGKTTLLKIMAGITQPTFGDVKIFGKIVSLIDLEAGMHPDFTGEENIFLNGLLVGMTRKAIRDKFSDIVSFADIGQFIDTPLRTYSWGMRLRLSFSVAVHSNPDILVMDEGLAVGDEFFRKKALIKLKSMIQNGKTIIVVTHWLDFLKRNCERIIWLNQGELKADGGVEILDRYKKTDF